VENSPGDTPMTHPHYQPKRMLVTGGAGFIGSHFVRYLLAHRSDVEIVNYDKLTYASSLDYLKDLPNAHHHHFIQGDIADEATVRHIMQHHAIDTIVHFAAESHVDRSIANPDIFLESNVIGTGVLLKVARSIWLEEKGYDATHCRFHHISTDEVFGSLHGNDLPATETSPYQPRSPYAASKAASDHWVQAYFHTYGLPITISNCTNNYGFNQHAEKFIPTIIRSCFAQKPIPIYGQGNNIRDWLYVDDHCQAILDIIERGTVGESYNVGGNNEWENLKLAHLICDILDTLKPDKAPYATLIQYVTDRAGHDFRYALNTKKIQQELGWQPKETFESGIRKVLAHHLSRVMLCA
jgi:dTDP-glucose 4,6-dehydratase